MNILEDNKYYVYITAPDVTLNPVQQDRMETLRRIYEATSPPTTTTSEILKTTSVATTEGNTDIFTTQNIPFTTTFTTMLSSSSINEYESEKRNDHTKNAKNLVIDFFAPKYFRFVYKLENYRRNKPVNIDSNGNII